MVLEKFYAGEEITISDISDISLIGTNFRLLIFKDFVVIGFYGQIGKQKQCTKEADESGFNFLTGKNE